VTEETQANRRRAAALVGVEVVALTLLLGLLASLLLSGAGFLVALVIVGGAAWLATRQATRTVLRRVGGRPADPVAHARLHNLVEGLSAAVGVPKPVLVVVDADAPNAMAFGRRPRDAVLVVTQGLLDKLTRVELEGVLAHELSHIKALDILPATTAAVLAAPLGARAVALAVRADKEALADVTAVAITRYPPGLLSALEKIEADPAPFRPPSRTIDHLWLRPPETVGVDRQPFDERIEALREL
jgi:heat shock protein HtpX